MSRNRRRDGEAAEALRQAIAVSDLSQNEIARRAGIDSGMVSRFVNRERGMTLTTADKVAKVLGLALRVVPRDADRKRR